MKEKKLTLKDELQAWAGAIGSMVGLFLFCVFLGVVFMDYDPRTMIEGIKEELAAIFG